jgi:hypothetical protein
MKGTLTHNYIIYTTTVNLFIINTLEHEKDRLLQDL